VRYPVDRLRDEVAILAMHLGWSHDDVLKLTHQERQAWVETVARMQGRT